MSKVPSDIKKYACICTYTITTHARTAGILVQRDLNNAFLERRSKCTVYIFYILIISAITILLYVDLQKLNKLWQWYIAYWTEEPKTLRRGVRGNHRFKFGRGAIVSFLHTHSTRARARAHHSLSLSLSFTYSDSLTHSYSCSLILSFFFAFFFFTFLIFLSPNCSDFFSILICVVCSLFYFFLSHFLLSDSLLHSLSLSVSLIRSFMLILSFFHLLQKAVQFA